MIKNEFQYTNSQICMFPILEDATKGRDRYMRKAEGDKKPKAKSGAYTKTNLNKFGYTF